MTLESWFKVNGIAVDPLLLESLDEVFVRTTTLLPTWPFVSSSFLASPSLRCARPNLSVSNHRSLPRLVLFVELHCASALCTFRFTAPSMRDVRVCLSGAVMLEPV
jgi:hypothetical protein